MSQSLLVVGDTFEAALTAIFAARRGLSVTLCPRPRSLPLSPITIEHFRPDIGDLIAGRFQAEEEIDRCFTRADHPYMRLFPRGQRINAIALLTAFRTVSEAFRNLMAESELPYEGELQEPRIAFTEIGTVVSVGLAPAGVAAFRRGLLPREVDILAAQDDPSFSATLVAESLATFLPGLATRVGASDPSSPTRLSPPRRSGGARTVDGLELLPLGFPSTLATLLAGTLQEALDRAGIHIVDAEPARLRGAPSAASLDAVAPGGGAVTVEAAAAVLAAGKFASGGIASSPHLSVPLLREAAPMLGSRIEERIDGDRHFGLGVLSTHEAFRIGIAVDGDLRPLSREGEPISPRLLAAGGIIGGFDLPSEGSGFALLSAWLAAQKAAEAMEGW